MIQDIAPHAFNNAFAGTKAATGDYLLIYRNREIMLKYEDGGISFPTFVEFEPKYQQQAIYLFSVDACRFFGVNVNVKVDMKDTDAMNKDFDGEVEKLTKKGYCFENIQTMRRARPKYLAFAAVTGLQLSTWYQSHRFCGKCGGRLEHSDKERMLYCPVCGQMEYPKISPAVIIAVTHGNRLLLSKYAGREYKKYALLAGFAEIGETIEETVQREVMEEVGLKVKNIRYYKSQPWSFTDTLLFGFYADLDGGEDIILDDQELAMAEWFEREDLPVVFDDCSLTNEMIVAFKNGMAPGPFTRR